MEHVPKEPADYIHRIGRTARAQKAGDAIAFVSRDEADLFTQIERSIGKRVNRANHPFMDVSLGNTLEKAPLARRRTFPPG
jgi:superfamily II DNA/RNA helicase